MEVIEIAKSYGASVPFIRPKHLSDDFTGTIDVIRHATLFMLRQKISLENVCCVYPTSVFTKTTDLIAGLSILKENPDCDFVFSAIEYNHPIERSFNLDINNKIDNISFLKASRRTQDCRKTYHDAGQWYWGKTNSWLEKSSIFDINSKCLILPKHAVVDIDTQEDWQFAEKIKFLEDK